MALTFEADASVDTDLWRVNTAGVFTVHPLDGETVVVWNDKAHGGIIAGDGANAPPVWRSSVPLMPLPCLDFDGTNQNLRFFANDGTTDKAMSDLMTTTAKTILVAVYVENISTDDAAQYNNDAIFCESGGYSGIFLRNAAAPKAVFYNWSGSANAPLEIAITLNAPHVIMMRHDGSSLYGSVDGGAESSVSSGTTDTLVGVPLIGFRTGPFYNGRVGAIKIWNTSNADGALASEISSMVAKWVTGAANLSVMVGTPRVVGSGVLN